jgi:hypothetical protein
MVDLLFKKKLLIKKYSKKGKAINIKKYLILKLFLPLIKKRIITIVETK